MKVRIFYRGYENYYVVQYRTWGMWWSFMEWYSAGDDGFMAKRCFPTLEHAKEWLATFKADYYRTQKAKAAAKERKKKSGVVYEETL